MLPGNFPSCLRLTLPKGERALEVIKHVCAVLALNQRVLHDVLVKSLPLAEQCACAVAFKCRESPNDFRNRMQAFYKIAVYHMFDLLRSLFLEFWTCHLFPRLLRVVTDVM
ncbi:unnamed protein product [Calypogeia fissa]